MSYSGVLYRAFDDIRFAQQFAESGRFRLGRLDYYCDIESAERADASEGQGHYIDGEGASIRFYLGNPIYILSCSSEDVDLAFRRKRMGSFVVRINDPKRLMGDLDDFLKDQQIKLFGGVRGNPVSYNKGQVVGNDLDAMERAELSVRQKPPSFAEEKEFRIYTITDIRCPKLFLARHIEIDLARALSYVEILKG